MSVPPLSARFGPRTAARKPGRPRLADQGDTTGRILRIALEEFAVHGFDGVSVAEIARKADIAKPLIHYHFANKEQLWRESVQLAFGEMLQQFITLPLELKDLDRLSFAKVFIRRYVSFVVRHPALGRLIVIEAYKDNPRSLWLLENHIIPMHRMAVAMVEAAQQQGVIKPIPAFQLIAMVNGSINVFINESIIHRRVDSSIAIDSAAIDAFADNLIEVLSGGALLARDSGPDTSS